MVRLNLLDLLAPQVWLRGNGQNLMVGGMNDQYIYIY